MVRLGPYLALYSSLGKVVFTEMAGQELEGEIAFKADHAVFLNGFTKVSTVMSKLLG